MRCVFCFVFLLSSHLYAQNYYNSVNSGSSQLLRSSLHNLIDDHNVVSYESAKQHLQNTDADPNDSGNIILIYKQNSVDEFWDGGDTWNREHIWAASYGLYDSDAYKDLHNLKPADPSVNSSKGNKNFDNGGAQHDEAIECFFTQNTWEPADDVKGDIARILFYMDIRYEGGEDEPDLAVTEALNNVADVPNIGKLSTLLDWHIQDPVDDFEMNRNEVIYGIQGNRNPFIDHPEYVSILWGSDGSLSNALRLRGIMDFDLSGSDGKAFHLYAQQDIPDLSIFGIGVANNGSGSDGQEETLPAMSVSEGDHILLALFPEAIASYLGNCYPNFDHVIVASDALSQNGDDAIEVYEQGLLIETFGDVDIDGTGQSWEYENSWAYNFDGIWSYGLNCESCFYPFCSEIEGCTDVNAFNYNASADVDDGSCIDVVYGCMDVTAFNYNVLANTDDGSCESFVYGCTDASAFNYDPLANTNDNSCLAVVYGCLDALATNFNSEANTDDGSCLFPLTYNLSLQGILDFDLPSAGNDGKAIHLIANSDIPDLSIYGIGVANNGGGSDGQEDNFPVMSVSAGDHILFAISPIAMENYFGLCFSDFDHVLDAGSAISQNGDDAIELYEQNQVIETFGDVNVDGSGEVWEYTDSWAYKLGNEWTYGGINCTDDSETSASSNCPYPLCSIVSVDQQEIYFNEGWNIASTYIDPENSLIDVLFNPIIDDLVIVKDYLGNAYLPQWSFNAIGNAQIGQGYYVKTTVSTSLTFYGDYLTPEENPITIASGWNIIGYLRTTPSPLDEIFESLVALDLIVIIKDYLGAAYLPEFNFNGIGDLNPGQGYQIKTNGDCILQY